MSGIGKVVGERFEDAVFDERDDDKGVEQGDEEVLEEVAAGVFCLLVGQEGLGAFVHQDKAEDVGEPVADDDGRAEGGSVKGADDPREDQREGDVDEHVVPPGERGEHVTDKGEEAATDFAFERDWVRQAVYAGLEKREWQSRNGEIAKRVGRNFILTPRRQGFPPADFGRLA